MFEEKLERKLTFNQLSDKQKDQAKALFENASQYDGRVYVVDESTGQVVNVVRMLNG